MNDAAVASDTIRIAVADDHPVVRDGLVAMQETQPDFEIVGSAETGSDAHSPKTAAIAAANHRAAFGNENGGFDTVMRAWPHKRIFGARIF